LHRFASGNAQQRGMFLARAHSRSVQSRATNAVLALSFLRRPPEAEERLWESAGWMCHARCPGPRAAIPGARLDFHHLDPPQQSADLSVHHSPRGPTRQLIDRGSPENIGCSQAPSSSGDLAGAHHPGTGAGQRSGPVAPLSCHPLRLRTDATVAPTRYVVGTVSYIQVGRLDSWTQDPIGTQHLNAGT
jgi:hypothetical protein